MIAFPPAKINIGLQVLGKRPDGFHDLNTIFYPLPFFDALEIIKNETGPEFILQQTGIPLTVQANENLVVKALHLLRNDFPQIGNIRIHLHKNIPSGAGLGGGSSDAAFMLKLLNDVFHLELSSKQLYDYALTLGSDCPFFILNRPSNAEGRGEILSEIPLDLSKYNILLVNPGICINTGWAFSQITTFSNVADITKVASLPVEEWKHYLVNDFEPPVFNAYPEIKEIKNSLYAAGAVYTALTGTGSTVYGIFRKGHKPELKFPPSYFLKWC